MYPEIYTIKVSTSRGLTNEQKYNVNYICLCPIKRRSNTWTETWTMRQLKVISEKEASPLFLWTDTRTIGQSKVISEKEL